MPETNGKRGIHVVGVEATNFHRLRVAEIRIEPGGRFVKLTGPNGAGKTSLLRAIRAALGGAGEVLDHALNDEAEESKGEIRVELTNGFTIERRFTESAPKGYLTVTGPDGGKHGQGKLNGWLGSLSFDPLAYFDLKPERQREILLSLGRDPTLGEQLEAIRQEYARVYQDRTPWIAEQRRARAVPKPEGERPEPVDVSGEMTKLRELQVAERERQDAFRAAEAAARQAERDQDEHERADDRVAELERLLEEAKARAKATAEIALASEKAAEAAKAAAEGIPDPSAEIEAVQARISEADAVNAQLEPWKAWERAQQDLEAAGLEVEARTNSLERLRQTERTLIAEAGIPVPGLSFDPESGEPLLNGRPLSVASGAERIRMAVNVAQAANPELHICLVDEANDLDLEQLEELDRLAREYDFQVWGCRIGLESKGEIVVEDGVAKSATSEAETPAATTPA